MAGIKHIVPFGDTGYTVEIEQSCYYCANYDIDQNYCSGWGVKTWDDSISKYITERIFNDCSRWRIHRTRAGTHS